ncbi:erythronate-4-phosphate dehydrogenase [Thiomicrorhabdus immobilis]|uniref:Erythronate-4-phosphate dehydrogenase n=1 Tax=Thiomicrorhabdus immobilis TaxID=2791037 RepID=A0ABM7MEZ3_9GAMM|nr:4-phosphoerythronate dehydrogenase [Thiomicrorhabdus immobilis]BCN93983.1 erythronate-4-phosphate dehydrogenase [Thiomicrorhabdus immobilis]
MTNPTKTIIIDDAVPYAEAIFSHLGKVITLPGKAIDAETVKNADALIVRSRTQVNAELLANSQVSFVGSTVVGLDHIDQEFLKSNNIHFYSAQGCNANSVAEYIITALYELAETFDFKLQDKTLGIIGVGNVGEKVYNKAKQLGVTCLLNDPLKIDKQPDQVNLDNYVDLDTCLTADIITVHTPLTRSGKHPSYDLISAEKLAQIKPQQILINAARGGVINEQAWINTPTLANIIDCWENEPNINEALYRTAFLATPHIAGHSLDAKVAGSAMVYNELCRFWNTPIQDKWRNQLPPQPDLIEITEQAPTQTAMRQTLNKTHDIKTDDLAIRSKDISKVHNKYENYRRNFPIYREFSQHKIQITSNPELNKLLESLGFTLIATQSY